jgi:hypothetical protein
MARNSRPIAAALGVVIILLLGSAKAQDLDPRRYVNLPVGQNFVRFGFGYSEGDVNFSPSVPLEGARLSMSAASLAYLRTMDLGGKAASFDVYVPYVCTSGSAVLDDERIHRDVCGTGDALVRLTYNFVGAPALELSEFVKKEKELVVGASVQVSLPIGQYDSDFLVNIGANRWVIRPEIGMSIPLRKWVLEFAAGVRFFSDNDDYVGDSTLSQDPLYNLQVHMIYDLSPRQWLSLNANYFFGGATYNDGAPGSIRQENSRVGITWFVVVNPKVGLKLAAHAGVVTRVGNDSNTISMAAIYRWE